MKQFSLIATLLLAASTATVFTGCLLDGGSSSSTPSAESEKEAVDGDGVGAITDSETSKLTALIEEGNAALAAGDLRLATEIFEEAEELAPDNPFVKNNLGLVYMEKEYFSLAASHFREAVELLPYYYKAYNNLGNCYYKLEYYDLSAEAYEEALRIKPDYALAHWNYAMLLEKNGEYLDAIRHWQRYIALAEGEGDVAFARDRIAALRDATANGSENVDPGELEMGYIIDD
ncbi:MAG: tetratricopeptide repeat protein [Candidatus Coatesbacteria bacterium]|nr:tetratricopeptide repeat protein [Candidatus Coatesbacteria bacterium]